MTKPEDDFAVWLTEMERSVEKNGFLQTWKENLHDIVEAHNSGDPAQRMSDANLYRLMSRDPEFKEHFDNLPTERARQLQSALSEKPTVSPHPDTASHRQFAESVRGMLQAAENSPDIKEADGSPVKCLTQQTFQNWGRTVENVPSLTYLPKTKVGVCNIVKAAIAKKKTVRVAGYRHTWGNLYSGDGEVLISLLPLNVVDDLPAAEPPIDPTDELQGIELVGEINEDGVTKALCRIGSATTNEQFRRWCIQRWKDNQPGWTVPINVIMVEITWGGSNAPICHGAGWRHKTLSDLVAEVEFVNAKGELQLVKDPNQLSTAAGCFGLLGVVTSITLKLDPNTFANMKPEKRRIALTIPPPKGVAVPAGIDMSGITQADLDKAWTEFVERCENDYYAEWFWFTFQSECWINTWKNDGNPADAVDYPGPLASEIQAMEEYLAGLTVESGLYNLLSEKHQAEFLGGPAMSFLPGGETIVTPLIDGLHFRRGIQNMRVLDMEWEIPIPPRADDPTKPDWTICQKAWWAAITDVYERYERTKKVPLRLTLEMRIMADSNVAMAPQYGNSLGTCAIEVLTTLNTDGDDWHAFMQEITDAWSAVADASGMPLNLRPHWAKQWQGLTVRGVEINEHLKTAAYKDRFPEFKAGLESIAATGGYQLSDLQRLFSNPLLNDIFAPVFD